MGKEIKIILKSHIPEDEIEALAKCFLPDILDFFESEEGRQEFEQWKKEQSEKQHNNLIRENYKPFYRRR